LAPLNWKSRSPTAPAPPPIAVHAPNAPASLVDHCRRMSRVAGNGAEADDRRRLRSAKYGGAQRQSTGNGAEGKIASHAISPVFERRRKGKPRAAKTGLAGTAKITSISMHHRQHDEGTRGQRDRRSALAAKCFRRPPATCMPVDAPCRSSSACRRCISAAPVPPGARRDRRSSSSTRRWP
jgi:hypothetical protein